MLRSRTRLRRWRKTPFGRPSRRILGMLFLPVKPSHDLLFQAISLHAILRSSQSPRQCSELFGTQSLPGTIAGKFEHLRLLFLRHPPDLFDYFTRGHKISLSARSRTDKRRNSAPRAHTPLQIRPQVIILNALAVSDQDTPASTGALQTHDLTSP